MHLTINDISTTNFNVEACDSFDWNGTVYTQSGVYEQSFINAMGCDSIVNLNLSMNYSPALESIDGDNEVDVRLTPVSSYSTTDENPLSTMVCTWSIEPQDAGSIEANNGQITVTWSETYKGEANISVKGENECGLSEQSLTVNVKNSTNLAEFGIEAKIYPNPTNGIVNIEVEGLQRLTVMNILGQTVYDHEVEGDKAQIEMAQFGVGSYLIRIYTTEGILVKRVNVMQ